MYQKIVDKIKDIIDRYETKARATDIQWQSEVLKNGTSMQSGILYGYKRCYEDSIKEFENLIDEINAME